MYTSLLFFLAVASTSATNLYVSSYNNKITTLSLTQDSSSGSYTLSETHTSSACPDSPSWLQIDTTRSLLFCVNEGFNTVNGSISSLAIASDGSLSENSVLDTPPGPVNSAYFADGKGLAIADYEGAAISTYSVSSTGELSHLEDILFSPASNGNPPNPHQVVLDPKGQYLLVPDLGSDLIRVFTFDSDSLKLQTLDPLVAAPGSGPRHLAFWTPDNAPGGTTFMYLVSELAATVTSYAVTYSSSGLSFKELGSEPATGTTTTLPQKNAPAETRVSPDNRFLLISNRNDTASTLPSGEKSDSLSTFALDPEDGNLGDILQLWPAGGSFPRSFEINKGGDLVAVGLQNSGAVVIIARDIESGLLGDEVARAEIEGEVTSVVWEE